MLNSSQTGWLEAIEGVRLLHSVLRNPTRTNVIQWLLSTLHHKQEKAQVTALDSLAYLVWQTRTQRHKKARTAICTAINEDDTPFQLLASPYAWVRQRAIELLCMLDEQPPLLYNTLTHLLHTDTDSGVRACIAYILGEAGATRAIPDLIHALLDPDEHVAITAIHTLDQLASPDDAIVVYSLQEITCGRNATEVSEMVAEAQLLLKKWQRQK